VRFTFSRKLAVGARVLCADAWLCVVVTSIIKQECCIPRNMLFDYQNHSASERDREAGAANCTKNTGRTKKGAEGTVVDSLWRF